MNASVIREEVLGSAVEDYHGLWEIIAGLRGLQAGLSEEELKSIAENEIRELLKNGHVALFRRTGPSGDGIRLQPEEIEAALTGETNWRIPRGPDSDEILIGATELGEAEYNSRGQS